METWLNVYLDKYAPDFNDWHCLDEQPQEQLMMWLRLGIAYKIRSLCDQAAEMICTTQVGPTVNCGFSFRKQTLEKLEQYSL